MGQRPQNQTLMRQYLMGEAPELERDDLEEKYFNDDELFGELLDAQDQLIDDYRRGELSSGERKRFEQSFLPIPDRRREVEFAVLLSQSLAERNTADLTEPNSGTGSQRRPPSYFTLFNWLRVSRTMPGWILAAAPLVVILGATWSMIRISRLQDQIDHDQSRHAREIEQARDERAKVEEELARLKTPLSPAPATLSVNLAPGSSRSAGEIKKVTPGPGTQVIEFSLQTGPEDYAGYQASLQHATDEKSDILVYKRLEAKATESGKSVLVRTPAAMLETGDYEIELDGVASNGDASTIGKYLFQLRR